MHPQLAAIARELAEATERAKALVHAVQDGAFQARPDPGRWSVGECLVHLNLTTTAYLPLLDTALAQGGGGSDPTRRYRRDFAGWLLSASLEPPVRFRMTTIPRFVPGGLTSREAVISDFVRLQGELERRLGRASGFDLNRLRIQSPFNELLSYNLYSAFRVLAAHERRHLWQADQARARVLATPRTVP